MPNTQINVTDNGTITLATSGKYCDRNIDVNVEVEPVLQTKTVSPTMSQQSVNPDAGYDGLSEVTVGAMPTATQATPSISVSSGGLITATSQQAAGYVEAGTKTKTQQLPAKGAATYSPSTSDQTIASGQYLTGAQTIRGMNLQAKTASTNGDVTPDSGYDGLSSVHVDVSRTVSLQDKSVSPSTSQQTLVADSGYDGLGTVTVGAIPTATQATPSISVSNGGLITASATQSAGYVASGTKSATHQLTTKGAATINPSTTDQTIAGGQYLTGAQTIKGMNLQAKTVTQNGAVTKDSGYDGLSQVTVNVPTGTARTSSDVSVSGATVSVPAGLYSSAVSKSVASGSAGTPTATKGSVSNNQVTVTPSVTNSTGYISGGTKNGSGVTVTADELTSGTLTISGNGSYAVTNYKTVTVNITYQTYYTGSGAPSSSLGNNGDIYLRG